MAQSDLPELLVELASAARLANGPKSSGNFKTVVSIPNRNYVAAMITKENPDAAAVETFLNETIMALQMRIWHLDEKIKQVAGAYRGGQHILKTVGFDPATRRLVMKVAGNQTLLPLFPWAYDSWDQYFFGSDKRHKADLLIPLLASIAFQVLQALKFLHAKNIVHQDLKLENIMIDANGKVTVIDVGGAGNTNIGRRTGTSGYLTVRRQEEVIANKAQDARFTDDLYALGCTLIYCCMGSGSYKQHRQVPQHDNALLGMGRHLQCSELIVFVRKLMAVEKFFDGSDALPQKAPKFAPTVPKVQVWARTRPSSVGARSPQLTLGEHRYGYSTADEALRDPFLAKRLGTQKEIFEAYNKYFFPVRPVAAGVRVAPNPQPAIDRRPGRSNAIAKPESWERFVESYPGLVGKLDEATSLAARAALLKNQVP